MIDIAEIAEVVGSDNVVMNEDMGKHTTFRTGGKAEYFITPDMDTLPGVVEYLKREDYPYYIIGNGSNLLVKDSGYKGAIIRITTGFNHYHIDGNTITAGAGMMLAKLAAIACENGLKGLEFASGIPGTLGGAVTMNAGAYGGEMSQVLKYVKVMDSSGDIITLNMDELNLGYRHSIIMEQEMIVLEVCVCLEEGDAESIRETMNELAEKRKEKQPLEYPSAGSTFKRPEGYFAGKLIMDAGLRGRMHGGAQVSEKHCGFIVNRQNASATDIIELMEEVTRCVYEKYGVKLEPEVRILG